MNSRTRHFGDELTHWYAVGLACAILVLVCSGGLVTSHEAGMAVPDWPNTFGYNLFLFPVSRWVGGVLYEHSHRLLASGVGLATIGMLIVSWVTKQKRPTVMLCALALLAVVVQGVLGGLRVTANNPLIGLFHGCVAQSYLCLVSVIGLITSKYWQNVAAIGELSRVASWRRATLFVTGMVFVQLVLGAAMRHSHAGLSIHDFPTVYGGWVPPVNADQLEQINQARAQHQEPYTSLGLIWLQYAHRGWAVLVLLGIFGSAYQATRLRARLSFVKFLSFGWCGLVLVQIALGIWTVITNKAADVATSHVFVGALTLVDGVLLTVVLSHLDGMNRAQPKEISFASAAKASVS